MEEGLPVGTSIIMTERSEERSTTDFILRDHDENKLESKKATLKLIEKLLNEK